MPQIYFSSSVGAGATTPPITLPPANSDGSGSHILILTVALAPDGAGTYNGGGSVSVVQGGNTLVTVNSFIKGVGSNAFQFTPSGGVVTIFNGGGSNAVVAVQSEFDR